MTYNFTGVHPMIALADYKGAAVGSTPYTRFINMVTTWVNGNHGEYGYTPSHTVIGYSLTGNAAWIKEAIGEIDTYVNAQVASACAGTAPSITGDSYLYAGDQLQDLALVYDYGYQYLTDAQKALWPAFMDQVVTNIWNYTKSAWGGAQLGCAGAATVIPWSGWSITNPGNNYYYRSFMKSTQLIVLVTQGTKWVPQLQNTSFPLIVNYYAQKVNDGGSREGTGYGVSHATLFDDYRFWKASLGEDLSAYSDHARDSIEYWIHATVPTLDQFVPLGDQSRVSQPQLYDYHRNLVHEAALLSPGTIQGQHATWWLNHISISQMTNGFNYQGDLFAYPDTATAPTATVYYAKGVGVVFARSGWATSDSHVSFVGGQQEESHYGQEQGNFSFFKGSWRAVDSNIWSHSGINQDVGGKNEVRFMKGTTALSQNVYSDTKAPSILQTTDADGTVHMAADLSVAYANNATSVSSWKRDLTYLGTSLTVHDTCVVGAGVSPVFQVQVPAKPVVQSDGTIVAAGVLKISPQLPLSPVVTIEDMNAVNSDYASGHYRVSLALPAGAPCEFRVGLQAL